LSTLITLKQSNVDLVFATSTPLTIGIPALINKKLKGIKYVFEVRDLWPEVPIQMDAIRKQWMKNALYFIEKKIYRNATHIIALSPGMRDGVLRQGISTSKVSLIPNMSKKDEFYPRISNKTLAKKFGIDLNCFNAIHFGAMGIANGLESVLKAAEELMARQVTEINFIFLGAGKTEEDLVATARENNLRNVKFLGEHSMKTVSEIVNICDCSIVSFLNIPILYTNSPNKLFDTLSAGKPVIVNSAGWTKEMVEHNNCGIYVDPERPAELAEVLIKMQQNPEWVKDMGRNSRKLAEEVFDKSILCKKFVDVIEEYGLGIRSKGKNVSVS